MTDERLQDYSPERFAQDFMFNLPYEPGEQQLEVLAALSRFMAVDAGTHPVFVLNGYAGTGKSSLIGAMVETLHAYGIPVVLMAPTGRAAKVIGTYARAQATTIHRRIYRMGTGALGSTGIQPAVNMSRDTVYIVDEASMIGDSGAEGSLLEDLLEYVYSGDGCRLILVGDTAQLPPVGCEQSPAMSVDRLRQFGLRVSRAVLTHVVRQGEGSLILRNATHLRHAMRSEPLPLPTLYTSREGSVRAVSGEDLEDLVSSAYRDVGREGTVLITRSNRRAVGLNMAIRIKILEREEDLSRGERLMVAKNNYHWRLKGSRGPDFIANGDAGVVEDIIGSETVDGFKFADVLLRLDGRVVPLECKLLTDTLSEETASMSGERIQALVEARLHSAGLDVPGVSLSAQRQFLRQDPYVNALQVKYAYAVTCHKAQGGQWDTVFVDMGGIPREGQGIDFYRWLYTATTRATRRLYYVNADEDMIRTR